MSDGNLTAVVYDASEVVVGPADGGGDPPTEAASGHLPGASDLLRRYERAAVAVVDGEVASVGPSKDVTREYPPANADHAVDASGKAVVPGFVDSHTHALFAGDRSDEFDDKLRGKTYQEILEEGGGILRTVRATRNTGEDRLLSNLLDHLDTMLAHGTTTVEVKSGYGLDVETERQMLSVIASADRRHPVDVVPTFMGAHAVPEETDAETYTQGVIDEQIPAVADQGIASFCDVFCEEGAFTVEQSRRVLEAGMEAGLTPKVHAEELSHLGGTRLAGELGATSADHLLYAGEDDARALAEGGVTPVLLPGTAFSLGADYADARMFLELDDARWGPDPNTRAPLAIATDFNPNCYSQSMPFAIALSCVEMGMTPAEGLLAGTRGGAAALDYHDDRGTLQEGAPADMAVVDAPSHVHLPYNFGVNPVETVLKGGEVVHG